MIKKIFMIIIVGIVTCILFPISGYSKDLKCKLLTSYLEALVEGDLAKLNSLLGQDFEYQYYKNGRQKILNRDEELSSTRRLFNDLFLKSFNKLELFEQDKNNSSKFHFKLMIGFEDSPKVYTESFFRGALLEIDEIVLITVKKYKISKIIEMEDKKSNRLSYGLLKFIYMGNTRVTNKKIDRGWISELFDRKTNELLLIKKTIIVNGAMVDSYCWPDGQVIANFE